MKWKIFLAIFSFLFIFANCTTSQDYPKLREQMVEQQVKIRGITDMGVINALLSVPREEFVLPQYKSKAYADLEVPIGEEQTLDRPYEDAFIMQVMKLSPTDRVLEVGTGGGYLAALISRIVKEVYTIEIEPTLAEAARQRLMRLNFANVSVKTGDGFLGWPEHAPFNAVVFTCSPPELPKPIIEQLAEGGRVVLPIGGEKKFQELLLYTKVNGKIIGPKRLAAATFVPMNGKVLGE